MMEKEIKTENLQNNKKQCKKANREYRRTKTAIECEKMLTLFYFAMRVFFGIY